MDLLFKRYASPFLLLDSAISSCGLLDFVSDFVKFKTEDDEQKMLWEFYLHKVHDKPYKVFLEDMESQKVAAKTAQNFNPEATITDARNTLEHFIPEGKAVGRESI